MDFICSVLSSLIRGAFKTPSNIQDGPFNYIRETPHFKCFMGFWIRLYLLTNAFKSQYSKAENKELRPISYLEQLYTVQILFTLQSKE